MRNLKIERVTHMSELFYFATPPSDWLRFNYWGDVDNYKERELSTSVATIQGTVERDYRHKVSYWKVWIVKQKILEQLFGTHEESF